MKTLLLILLIVKIPGSIRAADEEQKMIYEKSAELFGLEYRIAIPKKSVLLGPRAWTDGHAPLAPKKAEKLALEYCRESFGDLSWETEQIALIPLGEDLWIYRVEAKAPTGGLLPKVPVYVLMNGEVVKWEFVEKAPREGGDKRKEKPSR